MGRQAQLLDDLITEYGVSQSPTRLANWSVRVLVGHLLAGVDAIWRWRSDQADSPNTDAVGYWDSAGAVAVLNQDWAITFAAKHSDEHLLSQIRGLFSKCQDLAEERLEDRTIVTPLGSLCLRGDDFVRTRVLELTVHGFDLQRAYGAELRADPGALAVTAAILDGR